MILVLGSSKDRVFPKLVDELRRSGESFGIVDEDRASDYRIDTEGQDLDRVFRIRGGECRGDRPASSVFVRHAVARTTDPGVTVPMGMLQGQLNRMLLHARCPVANQPANALSNYSKPYQTTLLAEAGFDVPDTLVTNVPAEVLRFYEQHRGRVIYKGVSNVMSLAQVLKPTQFHRLALLPNSPTQFQEYVEGCDYRVHVIGDRAFVTRLVARDEDYRRSAFVSQEDVAAEAAELPAAVIDRCIRLTQSLGLVVSGIDFKESSTGRLVALELNPFPQFTFYESFSGQPLTRAVVDYLIAKQEVSTNVFV